MGLAQFLLYAVGISLSGVMAPGAVTAATLAAGVRTRHAGAALAAGHGLVELPLMLLIMAGANRWLSAKGFQTGVALAGGLVLLWMGVGLLRQWRAAGQGGGAAHATRPPGTPVKGEEQGGHGYAALPGGARRNWRGLVRTGVLLSAGNPYFLLWWATIGLALSNQALGWGVLAFALFAGVHWLCDLVWLEALSLGSFHGQRVLGPRSGRVILAVCGAAMVFFAVLFLRDGLAGAWLWLRG